MTNPSAAAMYNLPQKQRLILPIISHDLTYLQLFARPLTRGITGYFYCWKNMDQYVLFVLLSPFAIAIASTLAAYCWRRRSIPTARALAWTLAAAAAYLFFNTLELVNPTQQGTFIFAQLGYLCIGALTVNWMAFALAFANRMNALKSRLFPFLWVIPVITAVLVFTNPSHHLIWKEYSFIPVSHGFLLMHVSAYGSWFWVFWLQSYLLILVGAALIGWNTFSTRRPLPMQAWLALAGALLPLIVNLVYVLRLIPGFIKDYSPLSYAFSGLFFAVSIFRYRLLELPLLARSILIDKMSDGMLTLDTLGRIADFNPAALHIFSGLAFTAPVIGATFPYLDGYIQQFESQPETEMIESEIVLPRADGKAYYDLQIRRLYNQNGPEVIGYLVSLHDVTEHNRLLQSARQLATEDALTGVFNRRHFIELAREELERPRTHPICFSILMIDIDYFKQVNDSLGHIGGDQILHGFAQRLRALLRSTDLLGRIGGDEFIVLLPDTNLEDARRLAERLCSQVAERPIETEEYGALPITISIGVSECSAEYSERLEPVIALADKGLYQAKGLGRNCVRIFDFSSGLHLKK